MRERFSDIEKPGLSKRPSSPETCVWWSRKPPVTRLENACPGQVMLTPATQCVDESSAIRKLSKPCSRQLR